MCFICMKRDENPIVDSDCENMNLAVQEAHKQVQEYLDKGDTFIPALEMMSTSLNKLYADTVLHIMTEHPKRVMEFGMTAMCQNVMADILHTAYLAGFQMGKINRELTSIPFTEEDAKLFAEGADH